jgi:hypothetical protein
MEGRPANETPSLSEILNAEEIISTGVLSDPAGRQILLVFIVALTLSQSNRNYYQHYLLSIKR